MSHIKSAWIRPPILSYGVGFFSTAAALVFALLMQRYLQTEPFVSSFLCGVMFAVWFGGIGPGLLAVVLSILAFIFYAAAPGHSFAVEPTEIPRIVLYAMAALIIVSLSAAQRRSVGALQRSEAYLAEAQRLSHTGSFGWRIATDDMVWSNETYQIFEVDQSVRPTVDLVLQRVHPDDRNFVQHKIANAAEHEDHDYEYRLLLPHGFVKHLHVRARRVTCETGEDEIVGVLMDVTAIKESQEALQSAQAKLAHVARLSALGEMSASIGHEINQPLCAIVANGEASLRWLTRESPEIGDRRSACLNPTDCRRC
jgi:K+-sensing histidine kinase KdpD